MNQTGPKFRSPAMPDHPHAAGHRKRLRERFLRSGIEGFADYEVVELLLTLAPSDGVADTRTIGQPSKRARTTAMSRA